MNFWLQGAQVAVEFEVEQQPGEAPRFIADPDKTSLKLPPVTRSELERMPDEFEIRVMKKMEDDQARFATYFFLFHVKILSSTENPDGTLDLEYSQTLLKYGPVEV